MGVTECRKICKQEGKFTEKIHAQKKNRYHPEKKMYDIASLTETTTAVEIQFVSKCVEKREENERTQADIL